MSARVYADTSALVKLVVREPESSAVRRLAGPAELVTSALVRVELRRALAPHGPSARSDGDALLASLVLRTLDDDLLDAAGRIAGPSLRSLDAVHLASALELNDDLDGLVTYDRRLADAAAAHGLRVLAPT